MLQDGASANGHGKEGESPFFVAVQNRHYSTANVFLNYGASLSGTHMGRGYVEFAVEESDAETLKFLKGAGANLLGDAAAMAAARRIGDPDVLEVIEKIR